MKGLSLWQPWATAVAIGSKTIETRGRYTHYRGPLVIHAAKHKVKSELDELGARPMWIGALGLHQDKPIESLPFGALLAVCDLVDCLPSDQCFGRIAMNTVRGIFPYHWTEESMGGYGEGRFGWILQNLRPLAKPVPFKAKQGFFEVPDELLVF